MDSVRGGRGSRGRGRGGTRGGGRARSHSAGSGTPRGSGSSKQDRDSGNKHGKSSKEVSRGSGDKHEGGNGWGKSRGGGRNGTIGRGRGRGGRGGGRGGRSSNDSSGRETDSLPVNKKRRLKLERQQHRPEFDTVTRAKQIWNKLRERKVSHSDVSSPTETNDRWSSNLQILLVYNQKPQ